MALLQSGRGARIASRKTRQPGRLYPLEPCLPAGLALTILRAGQDHSLRTFRPYCVAPCSWGFDLKDRFGRLAESPLLATNHCPLTTPKKWPAPLSREAPGGKRPNLRLVRPAALIHRPARHRTVHRKVARTKPAQIGSNRKNLFSFTFSMTCKAENSCFQRFFLIYPPDWLGLPAQEPPKSRRRAYAAPCFPGSNRAVFP
jgi:hypothetical protein